MGFIDTTGTIIQLLLNNEKTKILNVIAVYRNGTLRVFLLPRWTRLPINYIEHFHNEDKTIKPGSSEMAGLIVTVDRDVYEYSTAQNLKEALDYVSTPRNDLEFVFSHLAGGIRDSQEVFEVRFPAFEQEIDCLWRKGIEAGFVREECLADIESKSCEDGLIVVQYNKGRKSIVSAQRVDKRSKGEEKCPYCMEEKGREDMSWNDYVISANPYPYYDHHIVLVNKRHVYQFIDVNELKVMVDFVINAPNYMVVYNGPPGTSILGHMHFQAGIHSLPLENVRTKTIAADSALSVKEFVGFPTRGFVVEKTIK